MLTVSILVYICLSIKVSKERLIVCLDRLQASDRACEEAVAELSDRGNSKEKANKQELIQGKAAWKLGSEYRL